MIIWKSNNREFSVQYTYIVIIRYISIYIHVHLMRIDISFFPLLIMMNVENINR